jgi:DNA-binding transcriptional MerR regulator
MGVMSAARSVRKAPAGAVWTAGQVARELGISPATLRAWHWRYGIEPRSTRPGEYRRYTDDDLRQLKRMRDLVRSGMLPSDAARMVWQEQASEKSGEESLAELVEAARALDTGRCLRLVATALRRHRVETTWDQLCRPALQAMVEDQRADPDCIDSEHALSWAITVALHALDRSRTAPHGPMALLACTDSEQHCLPLEALAAALAERRVPVRMLGAATPTSTLVHAVRKARPFAVVLFAQQRETAQPEALRRLTDHPLLTVSAGPGWRGRRRRTVTHINSLAEGLEVLAP